ncbi:MULTISPECIES: hypothetical protein [Actinobacillus]|uniref:hypothetical protein n=1 Tax=Actinobacillus TaxID=713 RepID=UPI00124158DC|nr:MULTISPECIES: hypothetical protein [Actinobacillus]WGE52410.1 hypothetical protein NYR69_08145 [Actinobacillus equuli subsp. haemolyticus]
MAKPIDIDRPFTPNNAVVYGKVVGLELAVIELNNMGIDVDHVDFSDHRRPRLVVLENSVTRQLMKSGKAQNYGSRVKNGRRIYLNHTEVNGVRVIWESQDYRH